MKLNFCCIIVIILCVLFYSCKKDSNRAISNSKQVRSVVYHLLSLDSIPKPYTSVDSFIYDDQSRIKTYVQNGFDTISGNGIPTQYLHNVGLYNFRYSGNSINPSGYTINFLRNGMLISTEDHVVMLNAQGQVVSDTIRGGGGGHNIFKYFYGSGWLARRSPDTTSFYFVDSIWRNGDNASQRTLGANNFASFPGYQRLKLWTYSSYSNQLNPLYSSNSFIVLLFGRGIALNKNIESKVQTISYDPLQNTSSVTTDIYLPTFDSRGLLQGIVNSRTGEKTDYNYY